MSDLERAIPIIDAYFPAGLRRCVNIRNVYDLLDLNDSAGHWFTRILLPISPCTEGDDYIVVRINSAPIVLTNGNFYQYTGPRMGKDILCTLDKVIPAVKKTKSANAYAVTQYLTNALNKETFNSEPVQEVESEPDFLKAFMEKESKKDTLAIFENPQLGSVRVIMLENDPWFVAADVCKCLDIRTCDAMPSLDDDEKQLLLGEQFVTSQSSCTTDIIGGQQNSGSPANAYASGINVISESGLYSLILRSRKPEAKAFKRWVTHEVLPAIRKTGVYSKEQEIATNYILTDIHGRRYTLKLYPR